MRRLIPPEDYREPTAGDRIKTNGYPIGAPCGVKGCSADVYRVVGHDRCGAGHWQCEHELR